MIISKRFDINYRPLMVSKSIVVVGNVPEVQDYNAEDGTYTPDYTLTPLTLLPQVSAVDPDGIMPGGLANAKLANIKWYLGDSAEPIATTDTRFSVAMTGNTAGQLLVKSNGIVNTARTMRFEADFLDGRNGQIIHISETKLLRCVNSTPSVPVLNLGAGACTLYDPISQPDMQVVAASLTVSGIECPAERRIFVWDIYNASTGTWETIDAQNVMHYDVSVSADGTELTVDRSMMGNGIRIRCRAKYDVGGNPSSAVLDDAAPTKVIEIVRRMAEVQHDVRYSRYVGSQYAQMECEAYALRGGKILDNVEKVYEYVWSVATLAEGVSKLKPVAKGKKVMLPTNKVSAGAGLMSCEPIESGALAAWTDETGSVLTDDLGNVLLI